LNLRNNFVTKVLQQRAYLVFAN